MLLLNEHEPSTSSRVERTVGSVQTIQQACTGCVGWRCEDTGAKKGFRERVSPIQKEDQKSAIEQGEGERKGNKATGTNTLDCEPVRDA